MNKILLVFIAIVAALVVLVGVAYFVPARNMSQMNACRGQMRALSSSIEQWSMVSRATNGTPIDAEQMLQYFKGHTMPRCPAGGEYSVTVLGKPPSCSVHGIFALYTFPMEPSPKDTINN